MRRESAGDKDGVTVAEAGMLMEYGLVTASNNFACILYPERSVGVRFLPRRMVRGSLSSESKGLSMTVRGAVGGGKFVSSQYSGIRFARLRDCNKSSSLEI